MKNIIDILQKETKSLRDQYIKLTEEWAKDYFSKLKTVKEVDFVNLRGWKNRGGNMEHTKASFSAWQNIRRIIDKGETSFIKSSVEDAETHYKNSIDKLADRISKKGLDIGNLKAKTSHVGVNIETILTDGNKTVKAFTIIASGEIQRPHYRYLIK